MYARLITLPNHSFFLFGPRGTGKSTWLRSVLRDALWKNLLLDGDYLPLLGDSSQLKREVEALPEGSWIVIDEVQKIPTLLNEVHDLIALHGKKYKFALSGSSARKLRRLNVNLLAGRAIEKRMYPLTYSELGSDFNMHSALSFGTIPTVIDNWENRLEILTAYVSTYLKQEIQQEALVKNIGSFHRFLKIIGIVNSEPINVSGIARDASVSRSTAERYIDILEDTLVAYRLHGWQPRAKVREKVAPKLYLFDTGIARALAGRIYSPLSDLESGALMETYLLHELRAAIMYQALGGELYYWRSSGGAEVDFVWQKGDLSVGIEVKNSKTWRRSYSKSLKSLIEQKIIQSGYGVFNGAETLKDGEVSVFNLEKFLRLLSDGKILT